ncbi:uncharacterized protein FN964_003812 isoform 5-T6 [Alca torda]
MGGRWGEQKEGGLGAARRAGLSAGCAPWRDAAGAARWRRVGSDLPGAGDGRRAAPTSSSSPAWRRPRLLEAGGEKEKERLYRRGRSRRRYPGRGTGLAAAAATARRCPAGAAGRPPAFSPNTSSPLPRPHNGNGRRAPRPTRRPGDVIGVASRQSDCGRPAGHWRPWGRGEGGSAARRPLPTPAAPRRAPAAGNVAQRRGWPSSGSQGGADGSGAVPAGLYLRRRRCYRTTIVNMDIYSDSGEQGLIFAVLPLTLEKENNLLLFSAV